MARAFDFTTQLGAEGWAGDGYELTNAGSIELPEQAELPLEAAARLEPWVHQPAPAEPDPPAPLAPSQPLPDEALASPRAFSPLAPDEFAALAARPAAARAAAPSARAAGGGARAGRAALPRPAGAWLDRPRRSRSGPTRCSPSPRRPTHAALFAEGSRAEVPLIGTVKTPRGTFTVSGQVDRLAVSEREVLIVDYKTNRPPPRSAADVALAYRRQLALYRALLAGIYPGRTGTGFPAVDSSALVDGNRRRNARQINALRCRILTRPTAGS